MVAQSLLLQLVVSAGILEVLRSAHQCLEFLAAAPAAAVEKKEEKKKVESESEEDDDMGFGLFE